MKFKIFRFLSLILILLTIDAKGGGPSGLLLMQNTPSPTAHTWTGKAGDGNFNTAGNWWGGAVPISTSVAVFDYHYCSTHCNITLNANINVKGFTINSYYPGTITQPAGNTITIGTTGWTQAGGVFVGGNSAITNNGIFTLSGGSFTSTSGTLTFNGSAWSLLNSPTFNANSGTINFPLTTTITPGTVSYNNVTFSGALKTFNLNSGTMTVNGTLLLNNTSAGGNNNSINSGTIMAYGNVTSNGSSSAGFLGSAVIQVAGNAAGQTISSNAAVNTIPNLIIAAGSNPVTFGSIVSVYGTYTLNSVGTFNSGGSTLIFSVGATITPGTVSYNNVTFSGAGQTFNLNSGTMTVNGTLLLNNTSAGGNNDTINSGTIMAYGNVSSTGGGSSGGFIGSATVQVAGNAAGQTISSNAAVNKIPNLVIAAGANPVTFGATISVSGGFTMTSVGTFTTTGSTLILNSGLTMVPGTVSYNNVTFTGVAQIFSLSGGTLNVNGTLLLANTSGGSNCTLNSGTIMAYGNVSATGSYTFVGSVLLNFVGSSNQTVTVAAASAGLLAGNVTVNTTGGANLILGSAVSWNNTGQNLTVTSGGVTMGGYALTAKSLSLNSTTVTKGGGVLTVNGSIAGTGSLFGGTVNP
jgi:hypothetical protein